MLIPEKFMIGAIRAAGAMLLAGGALTYLAQPAFADTLSIIASRDNTLIENEFGHWSGGAMPWIFVGNTNQLDPEDTRRGLLRFDLAAAIPAGSTINSVSVRLRMTKSVMAGTHACTLHRMLADWGEGTSGGGGGGGSPATPDSATWIHRFYPDADWRAAGGDFISEPSASVNVGGLNFYTWSNPQLAADVQQWLDHPVGNFGWMLKGNEAAGVSAKRFDSRETTQEGDKPTLTVNFTPPATFGACCLGETCMLASPAACSEQQGIYRGDGTVCVLGSCCRGDVNFDGEVDVSDLLAVIIAWGACPSNPEVCPADVFPSGSVDVNDLLTVIANWGACS